MASDYRGPNRGMFGYEGEGFLRDDEDYDDRRGGFAPRGYSDLEAGPDVEAGSAHRGWNIGAPRPSYRGRGPKNYQRTDERIHEEVCERLAMDHDVDASDIEVNVSGGVVTLEGTVHERQAKRLAEDIADSVTGVNDVQNNLRVARQ